jgi:hypothetical protein
MNPLIGVRPRVYRRLDEGNTRRRLHSCSRSHELRVPRFSARAWAVNPSVDAPRDASGF